MLNLHYNAKLKEILLLPIHIKQSVDQLWY